jgi:putative acetyltransferase
VPFPVEIRLETPKDYEAIREVNRRAFPTDREARLVDKLREDGVVIASLVAFQGERLVGHIVFSKVTIETASGGLPAAALAPMAVVPELQRQGIGSALVEKGLEACRERGERIVIVLGEPAYYTRFGFSTELARPLESPYPAEYLMALEVRPGALDGVRGYVRYPEAFSME